MFLCLVTPKLPAKKNKKKKKMEVERCNANVSISTQNETFSSMGSQLKGSAGRLGRMAASGNKVAIFKLSGILIGIVLVLYYTYHLFF